MECTAAIQITIAFLAIMLPTVQSGKKNYCVDPIHNKPKCLPDSGSVPLNRW